jgi:hypothetical protein
VGASTADTRIPKRTGKECAQLALHRGGRHQNQAATSAVGLVSSSLLTRHLTPPLQSAATHPQQRWSPVVAVHVACAWRACGTLWPPHPAPLHHHHHHHHPRACDLFPPPPYLLGRRVLHRDSSGMACATVGSHLSGGCRSPYCGSSPYGHEMTAPPAVQADTP